MAWIESHQELGRHPKTRALARILGVSRVTAVGHLQFLWWWALDYAQDGDLSRYSAEDIADGCDWEGNAAELIDGLEQAGFIDRDGDGMRLHDWNDYAGRLIEKREANAQRTRQWRERTTQRTHTERITNAHATHNERATYDATVPNRTQPDLTVPNQTKPENADASASGARAPHKMPANAEQFDAVLEACDVPPEKIPAYRSEANGSAKKLAGLGYGRGAILAGASAYRAQYPDTLPTPSALAKWVPRLVNPDGAPCAPPPRASNGYHSRPEPINRALEVDDEWDRALAAKVGAGPPRG